MRDLIKQPNGKYCSVDYHGELDFFDYTEEDIIDIYIEKAKEAIKNAKHYGKIIERIEQGERCRTPRTVGDEHLEFMGFDKPYNELVKFIPRRPECTSYAGCDFTTYGKCPNCGESVQNGIGFTDEKCKNCGQLLEW
jgi:hypothetical protein